MIKTLKNKIAYLNVIRIDYVIFIDLQCHVKLYFGVDCVKVTVFILILID